MDQSEIKNKRTRIVDTAQLDITPKPQTRVFGHTAQNVIHDLYKLLVAQMLKNTAQDNQPPNYAPAEHCHFFHTVTSDGKTQNTSSTIGGHFHVMEIVTPEQTVTTTDENGNQITETIAAVYKCSPPMAYYAKKNKYGQAVKTLMLANEDDMHTHEVQYWSSEKIQLRQKNFEAAAFHATQMAKFDKSVPGVQ